VWPCPQKLRGLAQDAREVRDGDEVVPSLEGLALRQGEDRPGDEAGLGGEERAPAWRSRRY